MVTVVNNPQPSDSSGNVMGMIFGLIIVLVLGYLFIFYALPALRQLGTPQINVPSQIDVNVKQTQ